MALLVASVACESGTVTGPNPPKAVAVSVSPSARQLAVGDTARLVATVWDSAGQPLEGRSVAWASSDTSVAAVSDAGVVTAVAPGSATITASSGNEQGTATITVTTPGTPPVASVTIVPVADTLAVRDTTRLVATARDSAGNPLDRTITWGTSDAAIASVSDSGLVTAVAAGSATITASSEGKEGTAAITVTTSSASSRAGHVFLLIEENHDYADVIGNADMPYLNGLASRYGLATQYYANTHPSIGNYFMLATGQIVTNNDSYGSIVSVDNAVRRVLAVGKTWKSYAEDLPYVGYTGGDTGDYARRHNVLALLSDVANDSTQRMNLVPFTQFAGDLAAGTLPNYTWLVPNVCNDGHNCSLATADAWLETNVDPLIQSQLFQRDGLLIIVFDESATDDTHGGGRVACVIVGPGVKAGYQSTTLYQHESVLRLTLEALGITSWPGAAASAPSMAEFFTP